MKRLLLTLLLALGVAVAARAELTSLPRAATSFGAALAEGWVYAYGGNTGKAHEFHVDCIKGDFFRARVEGGEWESLAGGPSLLSPALVSYQGRVIRIGGMNARNAKGEKNDLHSTELVSAFDPKSGQWTPLASMPAARSSHDAVILGDTLYVGGGWKLAGPNEEDWHTTMLTLDLAQKDAAWKTHPQPFSRRALAMVAHGDRIWFLGGMNDDNQPTGDVDWYEPKSGQWGKGPALPDGPAKGFGMAACEQDGHLYASPLSGDLLALSADGKSWERVGGLRAARFFHRLLPIGGARLLAVGGSNRQTQIPDVEFISVGEKAEPAKAPASAKQTAPWPQWRGPARDGVSPETGWRKEWPAEGLPVLWKASVGKGMSSPVIAAGKVILHGNDGEGLDHVRAFDAASGQQLWDDHFPCASQAHEMPIVPPGAGATPTIDATTGAVFALSREGEMRCLELATGKLIWRKNLLTDLGGKRPVYGYTQSPLLLDGRLIVDVGAAKGATGSTVALEAVTGEVAWKAGSGEAGYSSARVIEREGHKFVALYKGEGLVLLDPRTGETLSTYATTAQDFTNATTPLIAGERILVSNTGVQPAALLEWRKGEAEMQPVWTHKQLALLFNSAIEKDGCLFAFNEKRRGHNEFTCVDQATGESRWVSDAVATGTFILADGHWIFLTREGEVVLAPASAKELKPTARFQAVQGRCYATPVVAEARLFIRSNAGDVVAYDLR